MFKLLPFLILLLLSNQSYAACGDSAADKRCQAKYLKDISVTIGDNFSDPGGKKAKKAKEDCCYLKETNMKKFEKLYGDFAK